MEGTEYGLKHLLLLKVLPQSSTAAYRCLLYLLPSRDEVSAMVVPSQILMSLLYLPLLFSGKHLQPNRVVPSRGLGFGPIVYLSSHTPDFNSCLGDAFLLALIKMLPLLFVVPIILLILGFWATITTHRCCKK